MGFPRNRRQIVHSCLVGSTSDKNSFHFIPTFPAGLPVLAAGMSICLYGREIQNVGLAVPHGDLADGQSIGHNGTVGTAHPAGSGVAES